MNRNNQTTYILIRGDYMELTKHESQDNSVKGQTLLHMLDKGINDMEAGRELSLEAAFTKISELRDTRKNAKL